ncbi:MAG: 23S rRNA (uracil(1939)-C(5))-methyltransferase RlmD [Gammaproteobacteria bacterium]|nr:23S rRNA (uracil(1939)-C(5))-methyltransferase RlmD [Gammaproteobacteria bacterium]
MSRRARRKRFSTEPVDATIESLSHDSRGVAHINDKAVFIDGALPDETVRFIYTLKKRDFAEGRLAEVINPSPKRIEPRCQYFGYCGGCSLQHISGSDQIQQKQQLLIEQLQRIGKVTPKQMLPVLNSPQWGYRSKARLTVRDVAGKGRVLVGFREKGTRYVADMVSCEVLDSTIASQLSNLSVLIGCLNIRTKIPQIEVAVGDNRSAMVFRNLEDMLDDDRNKLIVYGQQHAIDIYLQRHGPSNIELLHGNGELLNYTLPDFDITFWFKPIEFTQVNFDINRKMISRVVELLQPQPDDTILDLFCGIGNLTLPVARLAGSVVGVEGAESSVERAIDNAAWNKIDTVEFHRADLIRTLDKHDWAHRQYSKVLLDPSRAGAVEVLPWLATWQPQRIVYVSCNPSTLARDAGIIVNDHGYTLQSAGVMDMFPHTAHVESIAVFDKQ